MSGVLSMDLNHTVPKIFYSVDKENKISSKWISKETEKKHYHVLRDIDHVLTKLNAPNLDNSISIIESCGYHNREKEYRISLELATILLSQYQGKKSEQALNLVYEALYYYRNRAPVLEEENLELKNQIESLKSQKKIEKEKKSTYTLPIFDTDLFGNPYISRCEVKEKKDLSETELQISNIVHINRTLVGLQKRNADYVTDFVGSQMDFMNEILKLISKQKPL